MKIKMLVCVAGSATEKDVAVISRLYHELLLIRAEVIRAYIYKRTDQSVSSFLKKHRLAKRHEWLSEQITTLGGTLV